MTPTTYNPEATREQLVKTAAQEIWRNGFRAASLDGILGKTGLTKGALYHHFKNKEELGHAVVDEYCRKRIHDRWIDPIQSAEDPVKGILDAASKALLAEAGEQTECGCMLNNIAQEMAPVDDGFRLRVEVIFEEWRNGIAQALDRGKLNGHVRENVDSRKAAIFIVALLEGAIGAGKNAQSTKVIEACLEGLEHYLGALRPRMSFRPVAG